MCCGDARSAPFRRDAFEVSTGQWDWDVRDPGVGFGHLHNRKEPGSGHVRSDVELLWVSREAFKCPGDAIWQQLVAVRPALYSGGAC